jgi:hypothetical protein
MVVQVGREEMGEQAVTVEMARMADPVETVLRVLAPISVQEETVAWAATLDRTARAETAEMARTVVQEELLT